MNASAQAVDVDALNASFRGEVYGEGPAMTAERFALHVGRNGVDLARSPRWTVDGTLSGMALLALRGERAWIGAFGVVPAFRGRGLAQRYLDETCALARAAGATTIELEVLARNAPAVALYRRGGFAVVDELVVWSRPPLGAEPRHAAARTFTEPEIARVARVPAACWQREPASVAASSPCERVLVGGEDAPRAYAFVRRDVDRAALLDAGAADAASASALLEALDAVVPERALMLLNEPAHGPLHDAFAARSAWTETTRQYRMRRT